MGRELTLVECVRKLGDAGEFERPIVPLRKAAGDQRGTRDQRAR
jgi:hypothetical protein